MRSASKPDWEDMQGLILSAYPHLDRAAYCLLTIGAGNEDQAQKWLANHVKFVTNASRNLQSDRDRNLNIAVTYSGLVKLCKVTGDTPAGFSNAFIEGIDGRPYRSRILGDIGESNPVWWGWGGKRSPVDLLVMVFAPASVSWPDAIDELFKDSGMTNIPLLARSLEDAQRREHFGFVDGISQPILRGTVDAERFPDSIHLTELGEFVFGYPDALNNVARSPSLSKHPTFGANGTYLVFRQLFQSVRGFWEFMASWAGTPGCLDSEPAIQLASKVVGRQPDGTPLVPYVSPEDNEFSFAYDPFGNGCPIGAHVRRANPRDSTSTDLAQLPRNRHRVIRRGRSYGRKGDREVGLLFLCLNGDFERQFEFIHQNWINDPGFGGLAHERDPLVGAHDADVPPCSTFTIPGLPAPNRVHDLPRFVTVKGGEYFFLPGIRALTHLAGLPPSGNRHA
jgi:Dyp-type peroxidase family